MGEKEQSSQSHDFEQAVLEDGAYAIQQYRRDDGNRRSWSEIGAGFPCEDGTITLKFDALPVPSYSAGQGVIIEAKLIPPSKRASRKKTKMVSEALSRGVSADEIARVLNIPREAVDAVATGFLETALSKDDPRC